MVGTASMHHGTMRAWRARRCRQPLAEVLAQLGSQSTLARIFSGDVGYKGGRTAGTVAGCWPRVLRCSWGSLRF
eukprot:1282187-Prymnesium_polylepis.1